MRALSVFQPGRFWALLRSDAMSVTREPVLLINFFVALLLPIAIWGARSTIDDYATQTFNIANFSQYLLPFALILPALIIGWVTGMLLLEDRDDGPLLALEVTLIGKGGFLLYRTSIIFVLGFLSSLFVLAMLLPDRPGVHLLLAILTAQEAVMTSFILVALAGNKVEGLALSKVVNLLALVPLLAIIASPLRLLGGIIPSFWIGEIIFQGETGTLLPVGVLALIVHAGALLLLYRQATRRIG